MKPVPSPSLPQHEPDPTARRRALRLARERYTYARREDNPLAPIAVAGEFPLRELYGPRWALPYLPHLLRSVAGAQGKKLWHRLRGVLGDVDKLAAFRDLFDDRLGLRAPPAVTDHQRDGLFARNRIDGPNPLLLARVQDLDDLRARLPLGDDALARALGPGATLAGEHAAGNLFVADFELLARSLAPNGVGGRDSRWRGKYLPAPIALFCQRPGHDPQCDLVPVAIRVDQPGAADPNPVYLRDGSPRWDLAKTYVEIAEFNLQAMSSHIYRHHFVAEPFAVSSQRQLAPSHPIHVLLQPHTRHTIAVNRFAFNLLKTPGSVFDVLYAGALPETRNIMRRSHERWSVRDQELETDLAARGVGEGPREYPWRDDARLWTPVLRRFVAGYVDLYYPSDAAVRADAELQAFADELQADDGGRLRGVLPASGLDDRAALVDLLAQFLFIAGPGHAAVHFPQTDHFTYVPAFPGAAYRPPPREDEVVDAARIAATLPPLDIGAEQFQNNQIAFYRFDRFGDYGPYALGQVAAARPLIARLHTDLAAVEQQIEQRNRARPRPYPYLLPRLVPNSINI
ncbi:lipoxygenase family protein [Nannocystis bainbridge]|uniref:Lipoxygenase family protein n=1 Tax=Nannocystis bainbridge TaxID=2995303 RepID=A0ABT5E1M2_9BACT|nr:lipoxygenase family protein [Nannocystis bainbridge]MDC0719772.1 lipoxygenase family protein [Nannocystis bainbridge]